MEGLFLHAEGLQEQLRAWKDSHGGSSLVNCHGGHELLRRLGLAADVASSEAVFHSIDESGSGYISLDDLSRVLWSKAEAEVRRLFSDAASRVADRTSDDRLLPAAATATAAATEPTLGAGEAAGGEAASLAEGSSGRPPPVSVAEGLAQPEGRPHAKTSPSAGPLHARGSPTGRSSPGLSPGSDRLSPTGSAPSVADHLRDALVEQATRVIDLFKSWDDNGDGQITKAEFLRALPELGLWADRSEVDELFDAFDYDRSGSITFRELNRMLRRTRRTDAEAKMRRGSPTREEAILAVDVSSLRKQVFKKMRTEAVHARIAAQLRGESPTRGRSKP